MPHQWPMQYLQPNPKEDCSFYATAYICRCLGHLDVTAEEIKAWRENGHTDGLRYYEAMYPKRALNLPMETYWDYDVHSPEMPLFWMGPDTRSWVERHISAGQIALALVHRIAELHHAVVLLECHGDMGVLIMDPIYGFRIEPWAWILATGPGTHTAHHIDGWFTLPA